MKTLVLSLVLFGVAWFARAQSSNVEKRVAVQHSGDGRVETTKTEYFKDNTLFRRDLTCIKKGKKKVASGYTELYQNGQLVFVELWGPGKTRQRVFHRDGHMVFMEMDKDGDGIFEWAVIYGDDGKAYAVFKYIQGQGLTLLGAKAVEEYNEGAGLAEAFFQVLNNKEAVLNATNRPTLMETSMPQGGLGEGDERGAMKR